jgi:hypothetical protein
MVVLLSSGKYFNLANMRWYFVDIYLYFWTVLRNLAALGGLLLMMYTVAVDDVYSRWARYLVY